MEPWSSGYNVGFTIQDFQTQFKLSWWLQSRLSLSIRSLLNHVSYLLACLMLNLCLTWLLPDVLPCLHVPLASCALTLHNLMCSCVSRALRALCLTCPPASRASLVVLFHTSTSCLASCVFLVPISKLMLLYFHTQVTFFIQFLLLSFFCQFARVK